MFRMIPPAGAPATWSSIGRAAKAWLSSSHPQNSLADTIRQRYDVKHCYLLNSGRAALLCVLRVISEMADPERNEVVIPAYTCFSVAAAVVQSGLKIRLVDIDPDSLDFDYGKLRQVDYDRVVTVIPCNLFGLVSDWEQLEAVTADKNVSLVDDAAQSMGSKRGDKNSGCLGDVGIFSFGRGKNLSTYSGGAILTDNDDIAARLESRVDRLTKPSQIEEMSSLMKLLLYSIFLRPRCYWLPASIPFLGLGETVFDPTFRSGLLGKFQDCAGDILMDYLDNNNTTRSENARKLAQPLLNTSEYSVPGYDEKHCPSYLRLPVLCADRECRERAIAKLKKGGTVASPMYPSTIRQISGIERYLAGRADDHPGAQSVVDRLLTLPTHPYVRDSDVSKIISCLTEKE